MAGNAFDTETMPSSTGARRKEWGMLLRGVPAYVILAVAIGTAILAIVAITPR